MLWDYYTQPADLFACAKNKTLGMTFLCQRDWNILVTFYLTSLAAVADIQRQTASTWHQSPCKRRPFLGAWLVCEFMFANIELIADKLSHAGWFYFLLFYHHSGANSKTYDRVSNWQLRYKQRSLSEYLQRSRALTDVLNSVVPCNSLLMLRYI